jgi:hypothetical protein
MRRRTCDELEAQLAALQQSTAAKIGATSVMTNPPASDQGIAAMGLSDGSQSTFRQQISRPPDLVSDEELASWANEVTV